MKRKLVFDKGILSQSCNNLVTEKTPEVLLTEANNTKKALTKKVEDILADINRSAEVGDTPRLTIRNQRLWSNCIYDLDR